ncbi:YdeI/OmpD-associated family protein [Dyadobacter chenhuakuii]|uniref:YdeI/OmpD-associated family protein n=1 Tax=Dyadobacter chenhuakuii TaxID=2909339 RepID=A0A9X1QHH5_9BACT|nr:YdeI/OmpD-associated family protein [Dyadobacter chenhuakuii]MCF2501500.1 YdeI/OmpD-associated family protein [Dyadobacter chenhuakuii]
MENVVRFESILDRLPRKGGEFYMVVPDEVAVQFVKGRKPARVRCLLNGHVDFQCAIRPKGGGGFYINIGTPLRQQGKLVLGQKLHAEVRPDDSEFGRDVPEELQELLEMDEEGKRLFDESLPSHQRAIIYYVAGAKSVQVRIDRAIMMINRLKVK